MKDNIKKLFWKIYKTMVSIGVVGLIAQIIQYAAFGEFGIYQIFYDIALYFFWALVIILIFE